MASDRDIIADYRARGDAHRARRDAVGRTARWIARARLTVFLAGVAALVALASSSISSWLGLAIAVVFLAGFSALVVWHRRVITEVRLHDALAEECDRGGARVSRDWPKLPVLPFAAPPASHPFASDLNLFGDVSLTQLLGRTSAFAGRAVLREWLLAELPPDALSIQSRQQAVCELSEIVEWRERLAMLGAASSHGTASLDSFLQWAESGEPLLRSGERWAARALAALTIAALGVAFAHPLTRAPLLLLIAANVAFTAVARRRLRLGVEAASARGFSFERVADMFAHARSTQFDAPALRDLLARMEPGDAGAFRRLAQIASSGELRFSPMAYAVVQALVLWDFHVVAALDDWRRDHGHAARGWFRALGELEACASLATLGHDNPAWTYPDVRTDASTMEAIALAHPLLDADTRVANDVTVGPRGTLLLITGSNMAGKSTLLRSIGLNVVLAQLGAPVCAASLRMPVVRLSTSINVRDALEEGLSLFMAEALRLKRIVVSAEESGVPTLLYLADEMLRGTNTEERRLATVAVIARLMRANAIGAVATHDVELANTAELAGAARPIHFVEQFRETESGPEMWFDYRARRGLATSRNALRVLELIGLVNDKGRAR